MTSRAVQLGASRNAAAASPDRRTALSRYGLHFDRRQIFDWLDPAFGVAALVLSSGAGFMLLGGQTEGDVDVIAGDATHQAVWGIVYLLSAFAVMRDRRRAYPLLLLSAAIPLLVGLALASTLWSIAPAITLRRAVEFAGTTVLAYWLAARFAPDELLRLLAAACVIDILGSLAVGAALPGIGRTTGGIYNGTWRGIFDDKNVFGQTMALAAFTLPAAAMASETGWVRLGSWILVGIAAGLIVLAQSMSSLVVLMVMCALSVIARAKRLSRFDIAVLALLFYVVVLAVVALVLMAGIPAVLHFFGRDPTLTGREGVWDLAVDAITAKPLLGYGYGAFWAEDLGWARFIATEEGWTAAHAHNGLLELALDVGLVGVGGFLVAYVGGLRRAFDRFREHNDASATWSLLYLIYLFCVNITETGIARLNDVKWVLFVCVCLYLAKWREATRMKSVRRHAGAAHEPAP